MPSPDPPAPPSRTSYLGAAFATPANRRAALVTVSIAAAVLAFARVPLDTGIDLDLRTLRDDARAPVALLGFAPPAPGGRLLTGPAGRIVFHRPLPERFTLELVGRSLRPQPARIAVTVGAETHRVAFPSGRARARIAVTNADGAREIEVMPLRGAAQSAANAAPALVLQRVTVQ